LQIALPDGVGAARAGLVTLYPEPNYFESYPVKLLSAYERVMG
jgi:hypothetical protein